MDQLIILAGGKGARMRSEMLIISGDIFVDGVVSVQVMKILWRPGIILKSNRVSQELQDAPLFNSKKRKRARLETGI